MKKITAFMLGVYIIGLTTSMASEKNLYSYIGKNDSIIVTSSDGTTIFDKNAYEKRVPASILKLVTALMAFNYLTPQYHFKTEIYTDFDQNIKIKGYGDPILVSEEIQRIAFKLQKIQPMVNDIIMDATYFETDIKIPGVTRTFNPYDAPNGALCVNFNTVYFNRDNNNNLVTSEPYTPLLPFVERLITRKTPQGRVNIFPSQRDATLYAGYLFEYFFKEQGIDVKGKIRIGETTSGVVNSKDKLIYTHFSDSSIKDIVAMLMEYSNNFIANQLFIAIGAKVYGPPGNLNKGYNAARQYLASIGLNDIDIVEGSGISRENRVSAMDMIKILHIFEPYSDLLKHQGRELFKTGTLNKVRTRAGYIKGEDNYRFVVLINSEGKSTNPVMHYLLNELP